MRKTILWVLLLVPGAASAGMPPAWMISALGQTSLLLRQY